MKTLQHLLFYLIILTIILFGFYKPFHNDNKASSLTTYVFPNLPIEKISSLIVKNKYGTLTLHKNANQWTIKEKDGFPASNSRVNNILIAIANLTISREIVVTSKQLNQLSLNEQSNNSSPITGNKITLKSNDGYSISLHCGALLNSTSEASQVFGKHFDSKQFVKIEGGKTFLVNQSLPFINTLTDNWISPFLPIAKHFKSISYHQSGNIIWRAFRDDISLPYQVSNNHNKQLITLTRLSQTMDYAFSSILLKEVLTQSDQQINKTRNPNTYFEIHAADNSIVRLYLGQKTRPSSQSLKQIADSSGLLTSSSSSPWRFLYVQWVSQSLKNEHYSDRLYLVLAPLMDQFIIEYQQLLTFEKLSPETKQ